MSINLDKIAMAVKYLQLKQLQVVREPFIDGLQLTKEDENVIADLMSKQVVKSTLSCYLLYCGNTAVEVCNSYEDALERQSFYSFNYDLIIDIIPHAIHIV
ncbi:hypothetical protein [Chamaesiphon sp.]|uniref:hypothetical protein n=1 Tax=Chamaesiphon sp. TaxID=2814140 RepID=UPI003593EC09